MHAFLQAAKLAIEKLEKAEQVILSCGVMTDKVSFFPPPIGPALAVQHRAPQKGNLQFRWLLHGELSNDPWEIDAVVYLHFGSDTYVSVRCTGMTGGWELALEGIDRSAEATVLARKWKAGAISESVAYEVIEHLAEYYEKYRPQAALAARP